MSDNPTVLVTGATGAQGGAVASALLRRGHRVLALTRTPNAPAAEVLAARGAEIVGGDFNDVGTLRAAAAGADAAFAMTTPFEAGTDAETAQGKAVVDALKAAGVGHVVLSSVGSADRATGVPHFESKYAVETHLADSGVPYSVVAPVYFMDNLFAPWSLPALRAGNLAMALPADRPLQQVAVSDIGAFVASLIERREAAFGRRYDIAGDELTGEAAAAILSDVSGRRIAYAGFPPQALREQSEDLALMFAWFDRVGYAADVQALRREFTDVPWLSFADWASQQDWSVLR